ncbi:MAG: beta-ketoacyl-[acyl-carrier-protein] synthase family protein [Candidatus Adiutrix sp.]|jgi:3-oxoacyl-[acyl-carrier-protein] synthase II|nr:beta-ketoacyl-[acyl-carrier-protein] synthase family protein [Candidatus Adiutrix sp.]
MKGERVVISGVGAVSPFGPGAKLLCAQIQNGGCALGPLPGGEGFAGLGAKAAGIVPELEVKSIPRAFRRAMSPMGVFACLAAREALASAGLAEDYPRSMGLSVGGTMGSPQTMTEFFSEYLTAHGFGTLRSATFFKIMGHGAAAGLAQALGLTGRTLAPSAACAAGLQAVGLGYETIASGREEIMLCGGAEEFDVLTALTFDHILAASHNAQPAQASRPFDLGRDGLVCSEGAGIMVLESLSHAQKRGAPILAEIAGFATTTSPANLVHPDTEGLAECMAKALSDSGLRPGDIQAVNAHATATAEGDRAEGRAIEKIFGHKIPVNSFKGQLGHSMAASGALELILSLWMLHHNHFLPNYNLENPDPDCGGLLLPKTAQKYMIKSLIKNSFALGGVNASLVIKKFAC